MPEELSESFVVDRTGRFSIYHEDYSELSPAQARTQIKELLNEKNISFNASLISSSAIQDLGHSSGKINALSMSDGIVFVNAYHDGTDDSGEIRFGESVVLDTITGKAVTGINETWNVNEYKIIGIALANHDFNSSGIETKKIPIHIKSKETVPSQEDTIPYVNAYINSSMEEMSIPPYAIGRFNGTSEEEEGWYFVEPKGAYHDFNQFINGSDEVAFGELGQANSGINVPALVLYDKSHGITPVIGETWGTLPESIAINPYLPGWIIASDPIDDDYSEDYGLVFVTKDYEISGFVQQKQNWWETSPEELEVYAAASDGSIIYDGNSSPEYSLKMQYVRSSNWYTGESGTIAEDFHSPIFREGDIFPVKKSSQYESSGMASFQHSIHPACPFFDDTIGTVRPMYNPHELDEIQDYIPRHWKICDGSSNSIENGGSGLDFRGRFLKAWSEDEDGDGTVTGGEKTNVHTYSDDDLAIIDQAVSLDSEFDDHDNRPPYVVLLYVERVK